MCSCGGSRAVGFAGGRSRVRGRACVASCGWLARRARVVIACGSRRSLRGAHPVACVVFAKGLAGMRSRGLAGCDRLGGCGWFAGRLAGGLWRHRVGCLHNTSAAVAACMVAVLQKFVFQSGFRRRCRPGCSRISCSTLGLQGSRDARGVAGGLARWARSELTGHSLWARARFARLRGGGSR